MPYALPYRIPQRASIMQKTYRVARAFDASPPDRAPSRSTIAGFSEECQRERPSSLDSPEWELTAHHFIRLLRDDSRHDLLRLADRLMNLGPN